MPDDLLANTLGRTAPSDEEGEAVKEARENKASLLDMKPKRAAKFVRERWHKHDETMRKKQAQLKVNYMRYLGNSLAQVHPEDPNRVYIPDTKGQRTPPSLNKLRRSVHRYAAQVTSDEPVMEAIPSEHSMEARDAAEAATHMLRGEWQRMELHRELERAAHLAGIFRSSFWFFEWSDTEGGKTKAQMFKTDEETGRRYLAHVDGDGNEVEDADDAATIWKGNAKVEVLTPMNVRWQGGRYAHEADELLVGKVVRLGDMLANNKKARKAPLNKLLSNVPPEAEKWLRDIRGEDFGAGLDEDDLGDLGTSSAEAVPDDHEVLDEPVFVLHYLRKRDKRYPQGVHIVMAGNVILHRSGLRYDVFPIAHFKLYDEVSEPLGLSLIDMLKDPQELLDFVRGNILRHIQMMRRRWFLPQQANVSKRDLMSPDKSVIEYNARAGKPEAETQPEIAQSVFEFMEQAEEDYNDLQGLHPTTMGKHVPGVGSGRHAEALRQGDETLLGLTRTQFKSALEQAGLIILQIAKKEWTTERRVQYGGEGRPYIDKSFKRTDFGDTESVRLKRSTLLMLTPAQRLETIFAYAEMGAIPPDELRRLAPMADTAGVNLSEDDHIQRARRQNERFFDGPPDKAVAAWEDFESEMDRIENQLEQIAGRSTQDPELQPIVQTLQQEAVEAEEALNEVLDPFLPSQLASESMPEVALLHADEHARALASEKAERLREQHEWWVEKFEEHMMADLQSTAPPQEGAPEGEGDAAGMGPGEVSTMANPGDLPAAGVGGGGQ